MSAFSFADLVIVIVFFESNGHSLQCEQQMTMKQVREAFNAEIGASHSVAFFTPDHQPLPVSCTVSQALLQNVNRRSLELHAFLISTFWLHIFGYEDSPAPLEVAGVSTPAEVQRDIQEAVGIVTDDYCLWSDDVVLKPDLSFDTQGLNEGANLTLDLRLTVNIDVEQPEGVERRTLQIFGSQTVGALRQELGLEQNTEIVAPSPDRRVLNDSLHLCHIVSDAMQLQAPMNLVAEKKVLMSFEPIDIPHRRQKLSVSLSSTPLDLHEMLSEMFELETEFQLTVTGEALNKHQPLIEQQIDSDTVIQLDILRHCKVTDLWEDLRKDRVDDVFLYSTESPKDLFLRDFTSDQMLTYEGIDLAIFGSMLDIFGAVTGQHKCVILVDRDVERSLSLQSFERITQKRAWARSLLLDIVPTWHLLRPKEMMSSGRLLAAKKSVKEQCLRGNSLIAVNPLKMIISTEAERRLYIQRFARGSTHGDILSRMQSKKGFKGVGLNRSIADQEINAQMDLQLYLLASESRLQTKITVLLNDGSYGCCFEQDRVSFENVMVSIGRLQQVSPRSLFGKALFCCGCGRKISKEEEEFQAIPSDCCRVRSLRLTDRERKEVGVQTAVPRSKEKETNTVQPEARDVGVGTESVRATAAVQASSQLQSVATCHPPPVSFRIVASTPDDINERKTVTTGRRTWRALLEYAAKQLPVSLEDDPVAFHEEGIYEREGKQRRAMKCYDEEKCRNDFFDAEDGKSVDTLLSASYVCLRPSSPLPSIPNRLLRIALRTSTDVLTVDPQSRIKNAPQGALSDPAFVVLLRGLRRGLELYWEHQNGSFSAARSSIGCWSKEVAGNSQDSYFILVLQEGPVPRISVANIPLLLLRREGVEVLVKKGRLSCVKSSQPTDMERWNPVAKENDFYKKFVAAAKHD